MTCCGCPQFLPSLACLLACSHEVASLRRLLSWMRTHCDSWNPSMAATWTMGDLCILNPTTAAHHVLVLCLLYASCHCKLFQPASRLKNFPGWKQAGSKLQFLCLCIFFCSRGPVKIKNFPTRFQCGGRIKQA